LTGQTVTLSMLQAYMAGERQGSVFPPAIEAIFQEQVNSDRLDVLGRLTLRLVIVYNVFLINDLFLLPQTFWLAAILHFGVVTPVIVLIAFFHPKMKRGWARKLAATAIPFLIVGQIMLIYSLNRGAAADHYQYLAIMVVIYMNVNQSAAFRVFGYRQATRSTILVAAAYSGVLLFGHSPYFVKLLGVSFMAGAAYLSLMANFRMERDLRNSFLRQLQDSLQRQSAEKVANHDPLTGLANRRQLERTVARLWALPDEVVSPVASIMIDIDHFKAFNDRYGHTAGDTCLKRVAGAIAAEARNEDDLAVRYGGEEFLLLLPRTELSDAVRVAERVRRHVETLSIPHERVERRDVVTISLGVIAGPVSAQSFAELVSAADASLYAAKRNGRNQVWPPFLSKDDGVVPLTAVGASGEIKPRSSETA
jgi:diguanylate cyclase (GGDEF)-like protein